MLIDSLETVAGFAGAFADRLGGASLALVAAALALHVAKLVARARAWHNIVSAAYPAEPLRYRHSLGAYLGGVGVNAVVPARPGELLKLALLKRRAPGAKYEGLASTLLTESVFDTVAASAALGAAVLLGWTTLGGSVAPVVAPLVGHPWLGLALLAALAALGVAVWRRLGVRLSAVAAEARRGFTIFGDPGCYLRRVVAWQFLALVLRVASIACFLAAFHLPATIGTALLVLAVQSVSGVVPVTPNGAGTQQALLVVALGASATASSVLGFGAGAQLATTAADVLLACLALALMTGSLNWRRVVAGKPAAAEPAAAELRA